MSHNMFSSHTEYGVLIKSQYPFVLQVASERYLWSGPMSREDGPSSVSCLASSSYIDTHEIARFPPKLLLLV